MTYDEEIMKPIDPNNTHWKMALANSLLNHFDNLNEALFLFSCYQNNDFYYFSSNKESYAITASLLTPAFLHGLFIIKEQPHASNI